MALPKALTDFELELRNSTLSDKTIRNYLSDISQFSAWATTLFGTSDFLAYLTTAIIEQYKANMVENEIPAGTINRRLSALRFLGSYLQRSAVLLNNPAKSVANLEISGRNHSQLLTEFKTHLEGQKVSSKTIRNYLSDVRSFLKFAGQAD